MAVHRIGRTLLLDDLDIQELFMRSSQVFYLIPDLPPLFFPHDSTFELCCLSDCFLPAMCVVDRRLDMAERVLPAANRSEVAEEKEE